MTIYESIRLSFCNIIFIILYTCGILTLSVYYQKFFFSLSSSIVVNQSINSKILPSLTFQPNPESIAALSGTQRRTSPLKSQNNHNNDT